MPYYEYRCAANGRTLEVRHGMEERLENWGQLVSLAGMSPGETPLAEPVERLISVPAPLTTSTSETPSGFQGCGTACGCAAQN